MAFGTPIAALDVILGIGGVDDVMRGLRQVDRELRAQQQYRSAQQIRIPGVEQAIRNQQMMNALYGRGSSAVNDYRNSLNRLQQALAAPTRNYQAAKDAEQQILAAANARKQIAAAETTLRNAQARNAIAQRNTARAGLNVSELQQQLREIPTTGRGVRLRRRAMRQQIIRAQRTQVNARTTSTGTQDRLTAAQVALTKVRADTAGVLQEAEGAVGRFFNALKGLNPLEWAAGVFGAFVDVGKNAFGVVAAAAGTAFSVIGAVGNVAFGIIKAGVSVVGSLGSAFMGLAGIVGQAAGGVMSFLASPIVSAPLTGGLSLIISHFTDIIKLAGLATGAVAAFAAQQILTQGTSFEQGVSNIRAVAGYSPGMGNNPAAVENEVQRLMPLILQIGALTKYNNQEVAAGIADLLRGGLSVQQMNYAVARSLFDVSAATDSAVEDSAKVIDGLVQLFKVPEDQIVHLSDMVAGAVNSSLINMSELGSAIRQLGPLAQTMGITPEDTITALTMLSGAGFRGELGGTALRNMLIYLNPRSDKAASELKDVGLIDQAGNNQFFDKNGKMKSLPDIFALLRGASQGMTDEQQLEFFTKVFGTRSASAAQVFSGLDPAKFKQTQGRIGQQSAQGTANTMLDNVSGRIEILTGSLQSLASIAYMQWLKSPLNGMLQWMIDHTNSIITFATSTEGLTDQYKELFGQQSRFNAFLGMVRQFTEAGNFMAGMNLTKLQIGLEAIFTSGKDAPMSTDTFRKYLMNPLTNLLRILQLGRDAVLTFAAAWRGEWGGALTSTINPLVRIAGIFGMYWGKIWGSVRDLLSGRVSLKNFLGQLSGAFGELLTNLGGLVDQEGPGVIAHFKDLGHFLVDLGKGWWTDYLQPEVTTLWANFTNWIEDQKPALIFAWNDLWSVLLGLKPPAPMNPDFGISMLGTNDTGESGGPAAVGLGDVFGAIFTKGKEFITTNAGPVLDTLLNALQKWWVDHQQQIFNIGAAVGVSFATGLGSAIEKLIGPNWLQDLLIKMGAPKNVVDFLFPKQETGGTAPGIFGGTVSTRDPNGGSIGQSVDQAIRNFLDIFNGPNVDPDKTKNILDWLVPPKPGMKGTGGGTVVNPPGARDDWWNNPTMQPQPGTPPTTSPAGSYMPPPGTMPLGMPRVGEGGAVAAAAAAAAAAGKLAASVLAEAMVPRVIQVNGTGLTTQEFYNDLANFLDAFLSGRGGAPVAGGDRSSLK